MIPKIKKKLQKIIGAEVDIEIIPSEKPEFGHYSTNAAFKLAPILKKTPFEIANNLAEKLTHSTGSGSIFAKIEAVQPGFVNFWLSPEIFRDNLKEILELKGNYGRNNYFKGKKIMVEFTDPNPFKEFHIGHLMSNSIGEAISRILEWNGAKVKRANYQGDVGKHVANTIYGIKFLPKSKFPKENSSLQEKMKYLGDAYRQGSYNYYINKDIDGGKRVINEIQEINKKIYTQSDKEINKIYDLGRKWSLKYFDEIYKKLGTKFDYYFFESETGGIGKKIVEKNIGKVFEKSDGAIVFKGEKYGLHTRVFINSDGLPTYEAKEIGLFEMKMKKVVCEKYFSVTGNEINDYFKVMIKVIGILFPKFAGKLVHLSHGMLRLPSGKMSSRTGDVITAESLIGEVEKMIGMKMKDRKLSAKEKTEIEEIVAVGALKYSILKQAIGGDIVFDFDKSVSFEGDSGPYLQYAYTRAKSVLENAKSQKIKVSFDELPDDVTEVEILLGRFTDVVGMAGKGMAPHYIVSYLVELARAFNRYYAEDKIVDRDDKYSPYKIALTEAVAVVMKNGLEIIGIGVTEKM